MSEIERRVTERTTGMRLNTIVTDTLSQEQKQALDAIQKVAFATVGQDEVEEDFICPEDAHVLALVNKELVGYASIQHADTEFQGKKIRLGGFGGVCTRQDMQGKGIATKVCETAMEYLKRRGDDIAFLSIETSKETDKLYRKVGFVLLPRNFSWTNAYGEIKESDGGMIAPVNSEELFEHVLRGQDVFYVGQGYW